MENLNVVVLQGRLTKDVDYRALDSGTSVASLRVAFNSRAKKGEEWVDVPNFVNVTVWGRQAEACNQYLEKGQEVTIKGRLQWREWEKDGEKRQQVDIVADNFGGVVFGRKAGENTNGTQRASSDVPSGGDFAATGPAPDDDIPF